MSYVRTADGCRIHYRVTGRSSAPPVLMIQGLGMDKHGWDIQRLVFSLRYRVIALDNRGSGRSDKPAGDYDLDQMAADAVAVLDDVGVERAHVVGASMGGGDRPDPRRAVARAGALADARVHVVPQPAVAQGAAAVVGLGRPTPRHGGDGRARRPLGDRAPIVPPPRAGVGWLGPLGFGRSSEAFAAQVAAILAADDSLAELLATIAVPTLVVVGNQDILTPRGDSEELAEIDPHRRAGRHQRRRPRPDDRARHDVQPHPRRLPGGRRRQERRDGSSLGDLTSVGS